MEKDTHGKLKAELDRINGEIDAILDNIETAYPTRDDKSEDEKT
jgi:hypothetical protein